MTDDHLILVVERDSDINFKQLIDDLANVHQNN